MEQLIINKPLVLARLRPDKFPRLRGMDKDASIIILMEIITKAYLYKGYKFDDDNVKFLAETLYNEMMLDEHHLNMPSISTYEIGYAIKKAVMDNEDFFFSVSYLYNVIKKYCKTEGHDASEEARQITRADQLKQIESTPVKTMLDVYTGKLLNK